MKRSGLASVQHRLVAAMAAAGEIELAQQHVDLLGLDPGSFTIDPEALAAAAARRAEAYLQMSLPPERVHYIDSEERLSWCEFELAMRLFSVAFICYLSTAGFLFISTFPTLRRYERSAILSQGKRREINRILNGNWFPPIRRD